MNARLPLFIVDNGGHVFDNCLELHRATDDALYLLLMVRWDKLLQKRRMSEDRFERPG